MSSFSDSKKSYRDKERLPSGINGLDSITEGGFKLHSTNLIGGGAG